MWPEGPWQRRWVGFTKYSYAAPDRSDRVIVGLPDLLFPMSANRIECLFYVLPYRTRARTRIVPAAWHRTRARTRTRTRTRTVA